MSWKLLIYLCITNSYTQMGIWIKCKKWETGHLVELKLSKNERKLKTNELKFCFVSKRNRRYVFFCLANWSFFCSKGERIKIFMFIYRNLGWFTMRKLQRKKQKVSFLDGILLFILLTRLVQNLNKIERKYVTKYFVLLCKL